MLRPTLILRQDIDVIMTGSVLDYQFESLDIPLFVEQALLELQTLQHDTLTHKLQGFAQDLRQLPVVHRVDLLAYLRNEVSTASLTTRFLARLLLDVAEATVEGHALPQYLLD